MGVAYEIWPFENRAWEMDGRWWNACHVPGSADALLESPPHWAILAGAPFSGKSVALANLLRKIDPQRTFLVELNPFGPSQFKNDGPRPEIFPQIMAQASQKLRDFFWDFPEKLQELSNTQKEFFRWMVETYSRPRDYRRWLDGLEKDAAGMMSDVDTGEVAAEASGLQKEASMRTQIVDLTNLCRRLGFSEVLVIVDTPAVLLSAQVEQLKEFFTWLEPMHHKGFRCISALCSGVVDDGKLVERARGRVTTITIQVSRDQALEIAGKHIAAATHNEICAVDHLANGDLIEKLDKMVVAEFGESVPGAWVKLGQILLDEAQEDGKPLGEEHYPELRLKFYKKCMVLRILPDSPRPGVWRGPNFLQLDQGPYDLLLALYRQNGRPVYVDQLYNVRKENMHTLVSRLRAVIEPEPETKKWVYVLSQRNEGYWLENFI